MPTINLSVQGLWDNWQRQQRDNNIHRPAVERYIRMMAMIAHAPNANLVNMLLRHVEPVIIQGFVDENGMVRIRTLDGRHRLTAAHELGMATIPVLDTEAAQNAQAIFNL